MCTDTTLCESSKHGRQCYGTVHSILTATEQCITYVCMHLLSRHGIYGETQIVILEQHPSEVMEHLCHIYSSQLLRHMYKLYKHYTLTSEAAGKVYTIPG